MEPNDLTMEDAELMLIDAAKRKKSRAKGKPKSKTKAKAKAKK
jgi:hypothetical protein